MHFGVMLYSSLVLGVKKKICWCQVLSSGFVVRVAESALYEKQYRHDRSGLRGREAEASFKNWFAL
jgi:hypothetical protein